MSTIFSVIKLEVSIAQLHSKISNERERAGGREGEEEEDEEEEEEEKRRRRGMRTPELWSL